MLHRVVVGFFLALVVPVVAQDLAVEAGKPGAAYKAGETVSWKITVKGAEVPGRTIHYVLKKGGLTQMAAGDLPVSGNIARLETRLDDPGTILAEFSLSADKSAPRTLAGALVDADGIKASAQPPADFDRFWQSKVAGLKAVPTNAVLEARPSGMAEIDYFHVTLDNIRGTKVRGQLARPKAGLRLPALLIVQWAGVYPLEQKWATDRAREGWLVLNINAHDLLIDSPKEFYQAQQNGPLLNYPSLGNDDREKSYFLRMFLGCYRAADYLAGREDWDGKTLVVMGTSQGGYQALVTGGLHPRISAVLANVPAGCDHAGPRVGRQGGWPMWFYQARGKDPAKVMETSGYYDAVNFARNIKAPALVAFGLIDTTCPAAGVAAAFNQIPGRKEMVVMEHSDHHGRNNGQALFHARSGDWLKRLKQGTDLVLVR